MCISSGLCRSNCFSAKNAVIEPKEFTVEFEEVTLTFDNTKEASEALKTLINNGEVIIRKPKQ